MTVHGKRSMVGAFVALVTAAVLSACAGQPGAAAVVDGTGIPSSDVQTALEELGPYVQGASPAAVLGVLVIEPTVSEMASEAGVGASDEDAQAFLDQVVQQSTPKEHPTFSPASLAIARYFVAFTNLSKLSSQDQATTDINKRVADLDVEVNPRYGTLGKGNVITAPTPPKWIVEPTSPAPLPSSPTDQPGDGPAPTPSATP